MFMKKTRTIIGFSLAVATPFVVLTLIIIKYFSDDIPFSIVCIAMICLGILGWLMIPDNSKEEKIENQPLEQDEEKIVEQKPVKKSKKELAFDIIKEKGLDIREIGIVRQSKNYDEYLYYMKGLILETAKFTKEEYNLMKELIEE